VDGKIPQETNNVGRIIDQNETIDIKNEQGRERKMRKMNMKQSHIESYNFEVTGGVI